MTNSDPPMIAGTLCMIKQEGLFKVAFYPGRGVLKPRKEDFSPGDERAIARMLYQHGLIDETELFELVKEGREEVIMDFYPATLICAIVFELADEPNSIEEVKAEITDDEAKQLIFKSLSTRFKEPKPSHTLVQVRISSWYPRYLDDRQVG